LDDEDNAEEDSIFSEEEEVGREKVLNRSRRGRPEKATRREKSPVFRREELEQSNDTRNDPKKASASKEPKSKGWKQFRNLKVCPECNFMTRDHLARHITRWHNLLTKMAKEAAKTRVDQPPPLLASVVAEEMEPFAMIPDCMNRIKRLLRRANVSLVDKLPEQPSLESPDEESDDLPTPTKQPDDPPVVSKEPNEKPETVSSAAEKNTEKERQLSVRALSKEVGLNNAAPSSHVIMKKFKAHTFDKDRSKTKRVAKGYCDRLSKIIGYIKHHYPEENDWDSLVNVEGSREFPQKMVEANYTPASVLTYIKEGLM